MVQGVAGVVSPARERQWMSRTWLGFFSVLLLLKALDAGTTRVLAGAAV